MVDYGRAMKQPSTPRTAVIPAALSTTEWATLELCAPSHNAFAVQRQGGVVELRISAPDRQIDIRDAKEFAAVIAMANVALADNDSRKLTRAHVKLLRRVADDNEVIPWGAGKTAITLLRQLADVIESYMPPAGASS